MSVKLNEENLAQYHINDLHINKWIGKKEVKDSIKFYGNCSYSNYLKKLI